MFWRDAMKPNRGVSRSDLGVYCSPFIIVMDPPGGESEGFDKGIVRGLDVLVYEDRDHSVEIGHLSFSVQVPSRTAEAALAHYRQVASLRGGPTRQGASPKLLGLTQLPLRMEGGGSRS